jgi:hypothetical protein
LSEFLIVEFANRNRALHSVSEYAHNVALLHDEELSAIDFDFGPRPFAEQDAVTLF